MQKLAPGFDWATYLKARGANVDELLVAQPSAFTGDRRARRARRRCGVLKDQLLVHSLDTYADVLPKAVDDENFAFYGTKLNGTPENQPRWKRAVDFTTNILTDDVSKLYVAKYFPPESKAAMEELVGNIIARDGPADRQADLDGAGNQGQGQGQARRLHAADRLSRPVARLSTFDDRPATTCSATRCAPTSGRHDFNIQQARQADLPLGVGARPDDGQRPGQFGLVAITFPAAILQPPFFDPNADPAVNYGGIGAVIGHEMSHHFDDQGSKYDVHGNLTDWWTPAGCRQFQALDSTNL